MENSDVPHPAAGRLSTMAHGLDAKMSVFRREQRDQVWQALWPRQAVGEVLAQNVGPDPQLWAQWTVWGGITGFLLSGKDAPVLLHPSSHQGYEDRELTAQLPGRKMRPRRDPVPGLWPRSCDRKPHQPPCTFSLLLSCASRLANSSDHRQAPPAQASSPKL